MIYKQNYLNSKIIVEYFKYLFTIFKNCILTSRLLTQFLNKPLNPLKRIIKSHS